MLAALCSSPEAPEPLQGFTGQQWAQTLEHAAEAGVVHRVGPGLYAVDAALAGELDALRDGLLSPWLVSLR